MVLKFLTLSHSILGIHRRLISVILRKSSPTSDRQPGFQPYVSVAWNWAFDDRNSPILSRFPTDRPRFDSFGSQHPGCAAQLCASPSDRERHGNRREVRMRGGRPPGGCFSGGGRCKKYSKVPEWISFREADKDRVAPWCGWSVHRRGGLQERKAQNEW